MPYARRAAASATTAVIAAAAARGAYTSLTPKPPGGATQWTRTNHRGEPVTLLEGPAAAVAGVAAALAAPGLRGRPRGALAGAGRRARGGAGAAGTGPAGPPPGGAGGRGRRGRGLRRLRLHLRVRGQARVPRAP